MNDRLRTASQMTTPPAPTAICIIPMVGIIKDRSVDTKNIPILPMIIPPEFIRADADPVSCSCWSNIRLTVIGLIRRIKSVAGPISSANTTGPEPPNITIKIPVANVYR